MCPNVRKREVFIESRKGRCCQNGVELKWCVAKPLLRVSQFLGSGMFSDRVLRTSLSSLIFVPSQVGVAGQGSEREAGQSGRETEARRRTDGAEDMVSHGGPPAAPT